MAARPPQGYNAMRAIAAFAEVVAAPSQFDVAASLLTIRRFRVADVAVVDYRAADVLPKLINPGFALPPTGVFPSAPTFAPSSERSNREGSKRATRAKGAAARLRCILDRSKSG
ncbi:hypothetical protein KM043_000350 [Ampulex compressa]|nr:hypothetical protein KM043_000350 [Ampulex compressa]